MTSMAGDVDDTRLAELVTELARYGDPPGGRYWLGTNTVGLDELAAICAEAQRGRSARRERLTVADPAGRERSLIALRRAARDMLDVLTATGETRLPPRLCDLGGVLERFEEAVEDAELWGG